MLIPPTDPRETTPTEVIAKMKFALVMSTVLLLAVAARGNPVPDKSSEENSDDKLVMSKANFFKDNFIKYKGDHTVTNLLVAIKGNIYDEDASGEDTSNPIVFFNQVDITSNGEKVELGQYMLVNGTAQKIFDGRDSTTDLGQPKVYFGATDGLYVFNEEKKSADKLGTFTDNIVQLHITNGTHEIYILTEPDFRIYKVNEEGTQKTLVEAIPSAKAFVLDRQNNIYYYGEDKVPYVLTVGSSEPVQFSSLKDSKNPMLVRPAFLIPAGVPLIVGSDIYMLYPNGTSEIVPFELKDRPTAISVDAAILHYFALGGNIYEYNYVEIILMAIFGALEDFLNELKQKVTPYISKIATNEV